MNKTELISAISDKAGTSKKDSEAVLNAFIEVDLPEGTVNLPVMKRR